MLELRANVLRAERQKFRERLHGIRVCYAFHELMNGANGVGTDIGAGVVEYHVQDHVIKRFR